MSIYVLVILSFNLLSWVTALFISENSNKETIVMLFIIAANILAIVFQSILLGG